MSVCTVSVCFFFFNDTATTEIYTLSLHDALPISPEQVRVPGGRHSGHPGVGLEGDRRGQGVGGQGGGAARGAGQEQDRKSTRLNSSHGYISYAVFCLKKKNENKHFRIYIRLHSME